MDLSLIVVVVIVTALAFDFTNAGALPANAGPPFWVVLSAGLAIALGTYMGGWRIIQTLGKRVSEIQTPQGFAAESASAAVILTSSHLGFALSTTHVASGSVIGSGLGRRGSQVRWATARRVVTGWVFTLPAAAIVGAVAALIIRIGVIGIVIDAVPRT